MFVRRYGFGVANRKKPLKWFLIILSAAETPTYKGWGEMKSSFQHNLIRLWVCIFGAPLFKNLDEIQSFG